MVGCCCSFGHAWVYAPMELWTTVDAVLDRAGSVNETVVIVVCVLLKCSFHWFWTWSRSRWKAWRGASHWASASPQVMTSVTVPVSLPARRQSPSTMSHSVTWCHPRLTQTEICRWRVSDHRVLAMDCASHRRLQSMSVTSTMSWLASSYTVARLMPATTTPSSKIVGMPPPSLYSWCTYC